ncbi:MAG TPA: tetratricopeptide repeat protein [Usitatibacter sp.]|nr:tetratricopeptide repeat protein [Usitatibacter sp.]
MILLVVAAAGAYLWHTLSALAPRRPPLAAVRPIAPAPPAAPVAAVTPSPEEAKVAASTVPAPDAASDGDAKAPPPRSATPALDELLRQPQPAPRAPVELARSNDPRPRVAPDVEAGYRALVSGDLESAHRHYAAALASEPANVDAQLGLATVEARSGRFAEAAAAYRRTLDLDPRNPTALAGLAALADPARPEAIENALRADIARHPESAALEITLGNLLAGQGRWSEAQAAFFEAQRLQPENPDVAYNLAVSLDHLGQRRAAADFYRRALEARRTEAAQFDAAAASRRLAELSR